jgi:simple sugar transport system permease protein
MATLTQTIKHRRISEVSPARRLFMGIVELIIGILIYVLFAARLAPELLTTFNMTPGGIDVGQLADWVVPSRLTLTIFAIVCVGIGAYQIVKGFGRATNGMVGLCGLLLIFGFLIWQASGKTLNLSGMLSSAVLLAVPITRAAFAGILAERSGTINIAIEGMMLMSCMFAALIGSLTKSAVLGLLGGVLSAVALAMLHAVLCIKYKINQVVSGTVINIFSAGMTAFISQKFLQKYQTLNNPPMFTRIPVPLLSRIPFIGPILFNQNVFVYMMFLILIILQVALFSTRWGLRLRSVGEHPKAADTLGIDVIRTRYVGMLLSGVVAGIAGAFFTLGSVGRFDEGMTAGKGFIGLAAMIFRNWYPFGRSVPGCCLASRTRLAPSSRCWAAQFRPSLWAWPPT